MITTNDLKTGMTIIHNGRIVEVVYFQHVKPGKGGAFVRTKLKDVESGAVIDHTFKGEQRLEQAILETRKMQYIYRDGQHSYFMDLDTYEQMPVEAERLRELARFLKEETVVDFKMHGKNLVTVSLPDFVDLEVTKTDPGVKGDTASGGSKPATLVTGAVVTVPLFVNIGDAIRVDTRTGEYVERL